MDCNTFIVFSPITLLMESHNLVGRSTCTKRAMGDKVGSAMMQKNMINPQKITYATTMAINAGVDIDMMVAGSTWMDDSLGLDGHDDDDDDEVLQRMLSHLNHCRCVGMTL